MNIGRLASTVGDSEKFEEYCASLIPEELRHYPQLLNNQKYYAIIVIRKEQSIPWQTKKDFIDSIMKDCKISGFTDSLIEIKQIMTLVDESKIKAFYRKVVSGNGKR